MRPATLGYLTLYAQGEAFVWSGIQRWPVSLLSYVIVSSPGVVVMSWVNTDFEGLIKDVCVTYNIGVWACYICRFSGHLYVIIWVRNSCYFIRQVGVHCCNFWLVLLFTLFEWKLITRLGLRINLVYMNLRYYIIIVIYLLCILYLVCQYTLLSA